MKKAILLLLYVGASPFVWIAGASLIFLAGTQLWGHPSIAVLSYPRQWLEYRQDFGRNGVTSLWLAISAIIMTFVLGFVFYWLCQIGTEGKKKLFGETHWLTRAEGEKDGLRWSKEAPDDAIILGEDPKTGEIISLPGQENVALHARTGAGKGVSFVVPNARKWGGSFLCFSVKEDVVREAAAERRALGDEVFVFHVGAPSGKTHCWNLLGSVRRGTPHAFSDIQQTMFSILPPTKAPNPYWDNAARRMGSAAAVMLAETPGVPLNIPAVRRLIGRPDWAENFEMMIETARRQGRSYPAAVVDTILGWTSKKDEEGANSVRETITTALSIWEIPEIAAITGKSDFDIGKIRQKKMSVFVVAQPKDIRRYRVIYQSFFEQFIALNMDEEFPLSQRLLGRAKRLWAWWCGREATAAGSNRIKYRTLVLLDEFWALGQVSMLADAAAYVRSYGFRIAYVVQSKMQTVAAFGKEGSENLFLNTGAEILFGGTDQAVAKQVSEAMGTNTEIEKTKSAPRFMAWFNPSRQTESEQLKQRAIMLPQEISRMPKDEMVVIRPGLMPLRCKRIFWFKDRRFDNSGVPTPVVPVLKIEVERDTAPPKPTLQEAAAELRERAEAASGGLDGLMAQAQAEVEALEKESAEATALAKAAAEVVGMAELDASEAAQESAKASEAQRVAKQDANDARAAAKAKDLAPDAQEAANAAADTTAARAMTAAQEAAAAQQRATNAKAELGRARRESERLGRRATALERVVKSKKGSEG